MAGFPIVRPSPDCEQHSRHVHAVTEAGITTLRPARRQRKLVKCRSQLIRRTTIFAPFGHFHCASLIAAFPSDALSASGRRSGRCCDTCAKISTRRRKATVSQAGLKVAAKWRGPIQPGNTIPSSLSAIPARHAPALRIDRALSQMHAGRPSSNRELQFNCWQSEQSNRSICNNYVPLNNSWIY